MELFLNILWAAIAVGALFAYAREHVADRVRFRVGLGALICALTFLLPVISMTDDLHQDAFAVEDSALGKRIVQATVKADLSSHVARLPVSFGKLLATSLPWTRNCLAASFYLLPVLILGRHLLERAPPVVSA